MATNSERLTHCFQTVFPSLSPSEIPTASKAAVPEWDSVAQITLLTVVEEEFDIQFKPEELELLVSFDLVLELIRSNLP